MHPVVDVHVERHYRLELERPILEDVRLRIERGEHWALVGANGSGKSTLLAIVTGELWPSRGVMHVLGEEYGRVDKRVLKRRIGVVSSALALALPASDTGLQIAASGIQAMVGSWGPTPDDDAARARTALDRVGARSAAGKPYGVLSQGERQRVMIARALVNEPSLLVLDEPCSGLDPVARERFLDDLAALAREPGGPTQIHVTHHLEEVPPFVSHALVLREGRALASGPVEAVLTSATLSAAFGAPCRVDVAAAASGRRFRLLVASPPASSA